MYDGGKRISGAEPTGTLTTFSLSIEVRSMKAIVVNEYGGPEVLTLAELPDPRPGPGEALLEVRAASVNKRDVWVRRGLREPGLPRILGSDAAGQVIAVGAGVNSDWMGMDVVLLPYLYCGRCPSCLAGAENSCERLRLLGGAVDGGYAEVLSVPEVSLFRKPAGLSFEEAAAMPVVYLSAWHMLVTRARLAAGETALIWGASSGLGSAAIQIAKSIGARVITTAGGPSKVERARALGADRIVDYQSENVAGVVRDFTDGHGAAVVFDHVGAKATATSLDCLARGGRLVIGGATTGSDVGINLMRLVANNYQIHACLIGSRAEFAAVLRLAEQGVFRPAIDQVFRFDQAADAHRRIESTEHFGKVILRPG